MKGKRVNKDKVYAKLVALSTIYAKRENSRVQFLQRISYSIEEMTEVMERVCDPEFRIWIESAIPVMQCRENSVSFNR